MRGQSRGCRVGKKAIGGNAWRKAILQGLKSLGLPWVTWEPSEYFGEEAWPDLFSRDLCEGEL